MEHDHSQTPQLTEDSLKSTSTTPLSRVTFAETPDTQLSDIGELINGVRHSVVELTQAFENLPAGQGPNNVPPETKVQRIPVVEDSTKQLHALRKQLVAQDKTQDGHITKIKELIRQVLMGQITDQLRKHLREMIREQLGETIRERVAVQLANEVPPELATRMSVHKGQMREVKQSLHNAEARRTNAMIRSTHLSDPLSPLLKADGESCAIFPATLVELFALPVPEVHALLDDFQIPRIKEDPREVDLNKFMQFIGVRRSIRFTKSNPIRYSW
ncbi:hypothetical protein FRB95_000572 [Tulasnella sp. JGI-2019a]|nr:hypothetical protein FRB95_000572 [Tulasnella sp. JGI-2019a]